MLRQSFMYREAYLLALKKKVIESWICNWSRTQVQMPGENSKFLQPPIKNCSLKGLFLNFWFLQLLTIFLLLLSVSLSLCLSIGYLSLNIYLSLYLSLYLFITICHSFNRSLSLPISPHFSLPLSLSLYATLALFLIEPLICKVYRKISVFIRIFSPLYIFLISCQRLTYSKKNEKIVVRYKNLKTYLK